MREKEGREGEGEGGEGRRSVVISVTVSCCLSGIIFMCRKDVSLLPWES